MMNSGVKLMTGAIALALSQLAGAQSASPNPATSEAHPAANAPASGQSAAGKATSGQSTAAQSKLRDVRLSQLIGRDVRDPNGEDLGDIKDLVLDLESGEVKYAVVSFGGFMGLGEKLFAFPLSAFQQPGSAMADSTSQPSAEGPAAERRNADRPTGDAARDDRRLLPTVSQGLWSSRNELVLNTQKERLEKAPGFDEDRWPDFGDASVRSNIDRYWGGAQGDADRTTRNDKGTVGDRMSTWRASELLDADIVAQDGNDDIGEIEDVVVNAQDGKVRYVVLEFDKGWFKGDKLVSVPTEALSPRDDDELTFKGTKEQLAQAPAFDRDQWPDLNEPRYRSSVDRFVGGWGTGAAPMARPEAAPGATGSTPAAGDSGGASTPATGGGSTPAAGGGGAAPGKAN